MIFKKNGRLVLIVLIVREEMVATSYAHIERLRQLLHPKIMFYIHYQEAIEVH